MAEGDVVQRTPTRPATIDSLRSDLADLGVEPGMVLLAHTSLGSLGWVCGGPAAVILALEEQLGAGGTLVMPTHSGDLSDPAQWRHPPVPDSWWETIRETMPPYDPDLTPTRGMGRIPETFRRQQGVRRSAHPQVSFAAWGARAAEVTDGHALDDGLGEASPLARVYDLDGHVLLLGVGYDICTSLHLAEYRTSYAGQKVAENGAPITVDGRRTWVTIRDLDLDASDFDRIGESLERVPERVRLGMVAGARSRLIPQRELVDHATRWMEQHRPTTAPEPGAPSLSDTQ